MPKVGEGMSVGIDSRVNVVLEEGPSGGRQSREEDYPSPPSRWVAVATGVPGSPLAALTAASTILDGTSEPFRDLQRRYLQHEWCVAHVLYSGTKFLDVFE